MAITEVVDFSDNLDRNFDINYVRSDKYKAWNLLFETFTDFPDVPTIDLTYLIGLNISDEVISGFIMEYLANNGVRPQNMSVITSSKLGDTHVEMYFDGVLYFRIPT